MSDKEKLDHDGKEKAASPSRGNLEILDHHHDPDEKISLVVIGCKI